jgi:hypothetical protein
MPSELAFEFDPFELVGIERPKRVSREALERMGKIVIDAVVEHVGDGTSPVRGGSWKRSLSKEYKKRKVAQGGNSYADMILDGDMLLATDCVPTSGGNLKLRTKGSKQAAKADGHNNFSGDSNLPARDFIPKPGGTFKRSILDAIKEVAMEFVEDDDT